MLGPLEWCAFVRRPLVRIVRAINTLGQIQARAKKTWRESESGAGGCREEQVARKQRPALLTGALALWRSSTRPRRAHWLPSVVQASQFPGSLLHRGPTTGCPLQPHPRLSPNYPSAASAQTPRRIVPAAWIRPRILQTETCLRSTRTRRRHAL